MIREIDQQTIDTLFTFYKSWKQKKLEPLCSQGVLASTISYKWLHLHFPEEVLTTTYIIVCNNFPYPDFSQFDIPGLSYWNTVSLEGITFDHFIFLKSLKESILFHEMVHIMQRFYLGIDRMEFSYGRYLISEGYKANPYEELAYSLTASFVSNTLPDNFLELIKNDSLAAEKSIVIPHRGSS